MSDFTVDPAAVLALGKLVSRAAEDMSDVATHLDRSFYLNIAGQGFLGQVLDIYDTTHHRVVSCANTGQDRYQGTGTNLAWAGDYYDRQDRSGHDALAKLDATYADAYPSVVDPKEVKDPGSAASYRDYREPITKNMILYPSSPSEKVMQAPLPGWYEDLVKKANDLTNLASPGAVIEEACTEILGFDPFAFIITCAVGDWQGYGAAATGLKESSTAVSEIRDNLDRGRYAVESAWTGNAADQARQYLEDLSVATDLLAAFLESCSESMLRYAKAVYHAFSAMLNFVSTVLDIMVQCSLASEIAVPVIGGIAALLEGKDMDQVAASVVLAWSGVSDAVAGVTSTVDALLAVGYFFLAGPLEKADFDWPPKPYKNPAEN
jgi:hypothetical protein